MRVPEGCGFLRTVGAINYKCTDSLPIIQLRVYLLLFFLSHHCNLLFFSSVTSDCHRHMGA